MDLLTQQYQQILNQGLSKDKILDDYPIFKILFNGLKFYDDEFPMYSCQSFKESPYYTNEYYTIDSLYINKPKPNIIEIEQNGCKFNKELRFPITNIETYPQNTYKTDYEHNIELTPVKQYSNMITDVEYIYI